MKKCLLVVMVLFFSMKSYSEANIIFSISTEYSFHVVLGSFDYTKPETWQIKFSKIPDGQYRLIVTVTKPNTNYKQTLSTLLEVKSGYETTYFIVPYRDDVECRLAVSYPLKQLYNGNSGNTDSAGNPIGSDGRYINYKGKPVFTKADIADMRKAAVDLSFDSKIVPYLKSVLSKGYFYTEDVMSLMSALSFDANRLEFAKFAYNYTIDKQRYYKLSGSFDFSSNYDDLMRYVNKK